MRHEYPATEEEAWESAAGRCFAFFSHSIHVRTLEELGYEKMLPDWLFFRGIDWGGVDPFVCLFSVLIPGEPGFSIDPSCVNTIRECKAWSYDEKTRKPKDKDNHAPDAIRYIVTTAHLNEIEDGRGVDGRNGHLHIFREIYIVHSAAQGFDIVDLAHLSLHQSENYDYELSVADRSRPDSILAFTRQGLSTQAAVRLLNSDKRSEIEQGIDRVNLMMCAKNDLILRKEMTSEDRRFKTMDNVERDVRLINGTLQMRDRFTRQWRNMQSPHKNLAVHEVMGSEF